MNDINKQMQDATFRAELKKNPIQVLNKYKVALSADTQVKVLSNTKNTYFVVFPSATIEYDDLTKLQAAVNTVGSVGCLGTAGSLASLSSTLSTAGTVATVGTAGTSDAKNSGAIEV